MTHVVTLVIHGTFASEGTWWRLGEKGTLADGPSTGRTFADRLEQALADRGLPGTVWRPALDAGYSYGDFSWSGANRHDARIAGARQLARRLEALARRLGATEASPLVVNFVAHSHGGNVVLESLRWQEGPVQTGKIVLLGTPLISFTPKFRPLQLLLSYLFMTFAVLLLLSVPIWVLFLIFAPSISSVWQDIGLLKEYLPAVVDFLPVVVIAIGAVIGAATWTFELAWTVLGRLLMLIWKRGDGHAYGPPWAPEATLLTSRLDEADLLLQLAAAPQTVYQDWIKRRSWVVRVLTQTFLRPTLIGFVLSIIEITLERFLLGFSWWRVPFFNQSMANLKEGRHYAKVRRIDVKRKLSSKFSTRSQPALDDLSGTIQTQHEQLIEEPDPGGAETFRRTLTEVWGRIEAQVRLRHSMYYESTAVIEDVADALHGPAVTSVSASGSPS